MFLDNVRSSWLSADMPCPLSALTPNSLFSLCLDINEIVIRQIDKVFRIENIPVIDIDWSNGESSSTLRSFDCKRYAMILSPSIDVNLAKQIFPFDLAARRTKFRASKRKSP
jgi:hypothetical protein